MKLEGVTCHISKLDINVIQIPHQTPLTIETLIHRRRGIQGYDSPEGSTTHTNSTSVKMGRRVTFPLNEGELRSDEGTE